MTSEHDYNDTPYAESISGITPLFTVLVGLADEHDIVPVYIDVADVRLARQSFPLSVLDAPGLDENSVLSDWVGRVLRESLTGDGRNQCADCGAVAGPSDRWTRHARDCAYVDLDGNPWDPR